MEGLLSLLEEASRAIGRLDGMTSVLPNPPLFIYMYVRKEGASVVPDRGHPILPVRPFAV